MHSKIRLTKKTVATHFILGSEHVQTVRNRATALGHYPPTLLFQADEVIR